MRYIIFVGFMLLFCVSCGTKGPKKSIAEIKDAIDSTVMNVALYQAYLIEAKHDSMPEAAVVFDVAVDAQTVMQLRLEALLVEYGITDYRTRIERVGADTSLVANLRRAIEIEDHKSEVTFPRRISVVTNDGVVSAVKVFGQARDDARETAVLFANVLANIDSMQLLVKEYFVCSRCAKIYVVKAPLSCNRCGTESTDFYVKHSSAFPSRSVIRDNVINPI